MRAIRGKDTKPEMRVRRFLHGLGFRYRLHDPRLPGKPDLVFASRRKVIFVNGCFWHSHACVFGEVRPKTNSAFWAAKRSRTIERDSEHLAALMKAGWIAYTIWECQIDDEMTVGGTIVQFLGR
jgi:DNA mismatch endonuclease (patch repair protein)